MSDDMVTFSEGGAQKQPAVGFYCPNFKTLFWSASVELSVSQQCRSFQNFDGKKEKLSFFKMCNIL